jgi:hypothetical protein
MRLNGFAAVLPVGVACVAYCVPTYSASAPNSATSSINSIPLELHSPNEPVLNAKINDIEMPLSFDLGESAPLNLQQSALDMLGAVPTGESVKQQGIDGVFTAPTYKIARLQIGNAVFTDVTAKLDAPQGTYVPSALVRGTLGSGLLKSYAVVIDYGRHRMTLLTREAPQLHSLCRGTSVKFSERQAVWQGEAFTEAETDFGRVTLAWDTGAQMTVLNQLVSHAADQIVSRQFVLGGRHFGPYPFGLLVADLPGFDGMIGDDFFLKHQVCIDYPRRRVVIGK